MTDDAAEIFVRRSSRVRKPIVHLEPVVSSLRSSQDAAGIQVIKKVRPW